MSAILAILGKTWPYVLCAIAAGYLTHKVDSTDYERLRAEYAGYKAQVADDKATAQEAARKDVETQIQTRLKTEANNSAVIQQLQSERDSAVADRDFARRLLAAAQARPAAAGGTVPQASSGSRADGATGAPGSGSLAEDLGAAASECRIAIQRLAALQAELAPQL